MGRIRDLIAEWMARRAGARLLGNELGVSARHIVGPIGAGYSNAWTLVERDGARYLQSFDRRLPPSLHVSHRDQTRYNMPIPLPERCLEDWRSPRPDDPSAPPDP